MQIHPVLSLDNNKEFIVYDNLVINNIQYIWGSYKNDIENYLYYKIINNKLRDIESIEELEIVAKKFVDKIPNITDEIKEELYKMIES